MNYWIVPGLKRHLTSPDFVRLPSNIDMDLKVVMEWVEKKTGISQGKISSKSRKAEIVFARSLFFYLARKLTKVTWNKLGEMAGRDHTSVIYLANRLKELVDVDKEYKWIKSIHNL